jgi:hypothetical protein
MGLPFAADVFAVGRGGPEITHVAVAPNTGGGLAAPLGSFAILTTDGTWWRKFGAAATAWELVGAVEASFVYTATGAEGNGPFAIVIPAPFTPLPSANYYITYALEDVANHVTISFPNGGGDRTTLQFNVQLSAPLTLNDTIRFVIRPT